MIPIVMGAHPENYASAGPPNSYIHVDEFKNTKELSIFMERVANNEELYGKYFQWKSLYKRDLSPRGDFFCRACGLLYYADFVPSPKWESSTISFIDVNKCLRSGKWYWN